MCDQGVTAPCHAWVTVAPESLRAGPSARNGSVVPPQTTILDSGRVPAPAGTGPTPQYRERCGSLSPPAPGPVTTTATDHRVGATYFSLTYHLRYRVAGPATVWELAHDQCVELEWENGNVTTSAMPRGRDPELCPDCLGAVDPTKSTRLHACSCRLGGAATT